MKKVRLSFVTIVVLLMFFWPFIFTALAGVGYYVSEYEMNPLDYARISDMDYKAVVVDEIGSNGSILVTERLTYDIRAFSSNNLFWELWRDLPEESEDGETVSYEVKSVKQIMPDGREIVYEESDKLYWDDSDYVSGSGYGPNHWYHSKGPYDEYLGNYECLMFYINGTYRDQIVLEIEYVMNGASIRYGDSSELYISMYSGPSIRYLDSFSGEILIPNKDMPSNGNYYFNTYGTNDYSFDYVESLNTNRGYHTFSFDLSSDELRFKNYSNFLEFSLISYGDDKHIFTEYAPNNMYYYTDVLDELRFEQEEYEMIKVNADKLKTKIFYYSLLGSMIVVVYAFGKVSKIYKNNKFYKPSMEFEYFRDIPSDLDPHFAANLVFCKDDIKNVDKHCYSAILLSLVNKKYIELVKINDVYDWVSSNVNIIIKYKPSVVSTDLSLATMALSPVNSFSTGLETVSLNIEDLEDEMVPLTETEELYFNLIVKYSKDGIITMERLQTGVQYDYVNTKAFVKNVDNSITNIGIGKGYFQKVQYDLPRKSLKSLAKFYMVLSIIMLVFVNLISNFTVVGLANGAYFILGGCLFVCSLYMSKKAKGAVLLTQYGEDEYMKWRGLYNFLNSNTLIDERGVIELPIWEKYLVYATAFGISDKVIDVLKVKCPEFVDSPILKSDFYSSRSWHTSTIRFSRISHRSSSFSSHSGSSFGRSYGGGGRGGFGGGGGH